MGDLFVAFPGNSADGRKFIPDAIARGASAVLWQRGDGFAWNSDWSVPNLGATDLRALCGPLAHALLSHPSERLSLIAVTGTNGKTSISLWLSRLHPRRCAVIGTLGAGFADRIHTLPLPVLALGGLKPDDLDTAKAHGAHGVAGIRSFWQG